MAEASVQQTTPVFENAAGNADIVLGLISYNSAETIRAAIQAAQEGLASRFPGRNCVLVNADGGSKDGTQKLALESATQKSRFVQIAYPIYPVQKLSSEYYGVPGKANALQAIFTAALERHAGACVIVDSNVRTIAPEWIDALAGPVIEDEFDFVSPCYSRHKYEGTIIGGIVYPLTRALYGKRVQQPIGGEFAVSAKLLKHLWGQPQLDVEAAGFNFTGSIIDIWVTIKAASGGFRVAQALLGPRVLSQSEPVPEVSSMLVQALGSVFTEMDQTASIWQRVRGSEKVPSFGSREDLPAEPPPVDINPMLQSFRLGYQNLQDVWRMALPPATLVALKRMSLRSADAFRFDDALWARTVYDFALAWRMRVIDRDHLLRALTPLYLGWVASYVNTVRDASPEQAQERIEELCLAYEAEKGYLISRWRWPDRFNP
jgi:hypothetical protein